MERSYRQWKISSRSRILCQFENPWSNLSPPPHKCISSTPTKRDDSTHSRQVYIAKSLACRSALFSMNIFKTDIWRSGDVAEGWLTSSSSSPAFFTWYYFLSHDEAALWTRMSTNERETSVRGCHLSVSISRYITCVLIKPLHSWGLSRWDSVWWAKVIGVTRWLISLSSYASQVLLLKCFTLCVHLYSYIMPRYQVFDCNIQASKLGQACLLR
jgi:hypothetical protein